MVNNNQYTRLLKLRTRYIYRHFFMFIVSICIYNYFEFSGFTAFLFCIFYVSYMYIEIFLFLSKNICPYCKESFFIFGKNGMEINGISFIFQKRCINCGNPNPDKKEYKR